MLSVCLKSDTNYDTLHEGQSSSTVLCVYDTVGVRVTRYKLGLIRPRIRATLLKGHGSDFSANRLPFEQAS